MIERLDSHPDVRSEYRGTLSARPNRRAPRTSSSRTATRRRRVANRAIAFRSQKEDIGRLRAGVELADFPL
jgi:hypothetical protein